MAEDLTASEVVALEILRDAGGWVREAWLRWRVDSEALETLGRRGLVRFADLGVEQAEGWADDPHARITDAGQRTLDPSFDPLALMASLGVAPVPGTAPE